MAYHEANKGSEKYEFQKVLFEHYFSCSLSKSNLNNIRKQKHKNKSEYEELYSYYQQAECLPKGFEYGNDDFVKYMIDFSEKKLNNPTKYSSQMLLSKVCKCESCGIDCENSSRWKVESFILMAAEYGSKNIIEWLISEKKIKIDYIDNHGQNILFYASKYKDSKFMSWLIDDMKVDVNLIDKYGNNILSEACVNDNLEIVKYLIDEKGFDVDKLNKYQQSCIYSCCHAKTNNVFDYLVSKYSIDIHNITDKYGLSVMHNSRRTTFLNHLIKNYKFDIESTNSHNEKNIMFYATSFKNLGIIDYVIKNSSFTIYNIDEEQNSILYISLVLLKDFEFSQHLIKRYKFDINYKNIEGKNILFSAISDGDYETVQWIITNTKIDITALNGDRYDIISDLIYYLNVSTQKYDSKSKVKIDKTEDEINLDIIDQIEKFKKLINFIFKNNYLKFKNKYILDICCDKSHPEINIMILEFFLKYYDADINYTDRDDKNILMRSISFNMNTTFICYIVCKTKINIFHIDSKKCDAYKYTYKHKENGIIMHRINEKKNNEYFKLKQLYEDTIRNSLTKVEPEKSKLTDSGCDLNFDQVQLNDEDKINLFDELLAHATDLKFQVLTSGKEPVESKNAVINELF